MQDRLRYFGWASSVSGWLVICSAVMVNPWFVFSENAFSDLGAASASYPWLFNTGMMLTGIMIVLFSVYLTKVALNRVAGVGGLSMVLTGVMLMLIGSYPEGTAYHYLVSVWFFGQGALTVLIWGIALTMEPDWRRFGVFFVFLGVAAPITAVLVPWRSIAEVEAFGIIVLNLWVAVMTWMSPRFIEGKR